jgi:hypothetical protein
VRWRGPGEWTDVHELVEDLCDLNVTHTSGQNKTNPAPRSTLATRNPGDAISQQQRKRTENPFGWGKTIGGLIDRYCAASRAYGSSSP